MTGVPSARAIMVVRRAAKVAFVANTSIAESGGSSKDIVFVDMDEKADSSFSAKTTLSRAFAEVG